MSKSAFSAGNLQTINACGNGSVYIITESLNRKQLPAGAGKPVGRSFHHQRICCFGEGLFILRKIFRHFILIQSGAPQDDFCYVDDIVFPVFIGEE